MLDRNHVIGQRLNRFRLNIHERCTDQRWSIGEVRIGQDDQPQDRSYGEAEEHGIPESFLEPEEDSKQHVRQNDIEKDFHLGRV